MKIRVIARIILAVFIAAVVVLAVIEEDPWFKEHLSASINTYASATYRCNFAAQLKRFSLLGAEVELQNIQASSSEKDEWQWQARRVTLSFSWLSLLTRRELDAHVSIYGVEASSRVKGSTIPIIDHIKGYFQASQFFIPVFLRSIKLQHGRFSLLDERVQSSSYFNVDATLTKNNAKLSVALVDGRLQVFDRVLYEGGHGSFVVYIPYTVDAVAHAQWTIIARLPNLDTYNDECTLSGTWQPGQAQLSMRCIDPSLYATTQLENGQISGQVKLPLAFIARFIKPSLDSSVGGHAKINFTAQLADIFGTTRATMMLEHPEYAGASLPEVLLDIKEIAPILQGNISLQYAERANVGGTWSFDPVDYRAALDLVPTDTIALPISWQIAPDATYLKLLYDNGRLAGSYALHLARQDQGFEQRIIGQITQDEDQFKITGGNAHLSMVAHLRYLPTWYVAYASYAENDKIITEIFGTPEQTYHGTIGYPFIRSLLVRAGLLDLPGQGTFSLSAYKKDSSLVATLAMRNGSIRLPYTYNMLQDISLTSEFDFSEKTLFVQDVAVRLHQGELQTSRAVIGFNDDWRVSFAYVPILIRHCFISWQKDFFGLVSGSLLAQYQEGSMPEISGHILLDRAQVRSNVLGSGFKKDVVGLALLPLRFYQADTALNIAIKTRTPVQVKTSFLDTAARIDLFARGTLLQPEVGGQIELVSGKFLFPYQPLYITSGKVYLLPSQLSDPAIEVTAKNTIKRYGITMNVSGSATSPSISFSSSPSLGEEQIIGLLFGGSEDGSLFLVMPSTIMNNIEGLLVGPAESTSGVQKYLKNLFKPFKNVRIVPSFSDQTGRGGLRGSLAIEVNDRWRGVIQKNFSLPEDLRIEIDYALSDDTRIRAIKDERDDLGVEVETRWKFSR